MSRTHLVPLLAAAVALACSGADQPGAATADVDVADAGFMTPESVVHDSVADVYLVSNINGSPTGEDDNGFISRVTPDGQVENLKWINGEDPTFTLDAPKGLAISGDTLFVADIDCVRMFHRVTGAHEGVLCLEGVTFLNDVAIGPEGSLFVTDSGLKDDGAGGLAPSGTDAVYRYPLAENLQGATLAKSADLGAPNGIAISSRGIFVVTFGSGEILRFTASGEKTQVARPSDRQLDGIVFLPDGGFLFSSWGDSAVYRVGSDGATTRVVEGVTSPADIGYDRGRGRVLIPLFTENRLLIREVR
jgi:sugar lactone lactonase YvrE